MTTELSAKKELLRSLMKCPHRKLEDTIPLFSNALNRDPFFAGKCFYGLTLEELNRIRDLAESAIAFLLTSPHSIHREAGRVCFQGLEPYRAFRVAEFIRLQLKPNRQVRGAVGGYLRTLEMDRKRFDGAVKVARHSLHKMYEHYHVHPSARAQAIIFERCVPEGEIDPVKLLREAETAEDQAKVIIDHRIPYRQATSVLKGITPAVWVALIEVMSPAEAMNTRAAIERSGILHDPDIRRLYEAKLRKVTGDKRAATSTITERKSVKGRDERLDRILSQARQEKIDRGARITVDTMIAVDCSGSMEMAIEAAKKICPHIASLCDATLKIYCFNEAAWPLEYGKGSFEDFQQAFSLIRADGMTSLGSALKQAIDGGFTPEQAIYITDQEENRRPQLVDVFRSSGQEIRFVFVNVGQHGVAGDLEGAGAEVTEYDVDVSVSDVGWYAALDNITPLLTKGGYSQLVEQIMALELPRRT